MQIRPMSIRQPSGEGRRVYHHPAHLGDRVRCPHCGGFGPSNGSETTEDGSLMTQWRRCRGCGKAYQTCLDLNPSN
jgi:Pyruvate/2-oxoacid:ferredoxin oxidoreductase delta subunit